MKRLLIVVLLCAAGVFPAFTQQEHQLSVYAAPYGTIPIGSSAEVFNFGGGGEVSVSFLPSFLPLLGVQAGGIFTALPLESQQSSIWSLAGFGGLVFRMPLSERLSLVASGRAGYYYWGPVGWDSGGANGGGLFLGAGAGAFFRIAGPLTLGAEVSYNLYSNLFNGIGFKLNVSLDFPGLESEKNNLEIKGIKLLPLFPVLYSYYDNHPVGTVTVANTGGKTVNDVSVRFFVDQYMDNPIASKTKIELKAGEEKTVDLYALFNETVMGITEGTKTSAVVQVSYQGSTEPFTSEATGVLEFYNRNAMTWDDDKKVASFITAKDPEIMHFAKNVSNWLQDVENPAIDRHLQKGIAVFEAVKQFGIRYEVDPTTPFSEFSEQKTAIDFLQFPRQTLQYSSGDCDDLTVLYTALLEAVGIETAFITVPGHIYAAFALKTPVEEIKRNFSKPEDIIIQREKAWIPVEITMFQDSFEKAWQTGAKEWREHDGKEQAVLFETGDAWSVYRAVGFNDGGTSTALPGREQVTEALKTAIARYVEKEIYPQIQNMEKKISESQGSLRYKNKLAVIYARYGIYDKALEGFLAILQQRDYLPAVINAANINFLQENFGAALELYNKALDQNGENRSALLGVARCNHELENYGFVRQAYEKIQKIDPDLAERYAYLDLKGEDAARASDAAGLKNTVLWEDEE